MEEQLKTFFQNYQYTGMRHTSRMKSIEVNDSMRCITVVADDYFGSQAFSPKQVEKIYAEVGKTVPKSYSNYDVKIKTCGWLIEDLVPNRLKSKKDKTRLWNGIEHKGNAWVTNISRPHRITNGLDGRHISVWASHGRYYDQQKATWKWQRPNLFCTTEDLFTQTIVVPYLIPMLENAGAIVFTPRERDWQKNEVIVDNDDEHLHPFYQEITQRGSWRMTGINGFARHEGNYFDNENPFEAGTTRVTETSQRERELNQVSWQPQIPEEGKYAVYVSYQSLPESVDDAQYIVCHKGSKTYFRVNQQMGGGTWVYLGTFEFDKGCNINNRVVLTNYSQKKGVVTADAVRFGGGMGNIERGGTTSGFPRALEGSRYYAQWAGAPYSVYSSKNGVDDYSDDINARSYMTNWLAGGSAYMPDTEGKRVPIELSLAIHSDAGASRDGTSLIGTLSICTTNFNEQRLSAGTSRLASRDLADALLTNVYHDISSLYGKWNRRELFDRNYSETRNPGVPSAILETLSHQNFADMRLAQDPNFRFTFARAIYKSVLRFINEQHGEEAIVQPLAPNGFRIDVDNNGKAHLQWKETIDKLESTARATSYNVYCAAGTRGFDNGRNVRGESYSMQLEAGVQYDFKITAVNRGGESFPTQTLSAIWFPDAKQDILVVDGFHRLSSPAQINSTSEAGFDINRDAGVTRGATAGWAGAQQCFDKTKSGGEGPGALGFCGDELEGKFIAGNDFNYVSTHTMAIASAKKYNVSSCSSEVVENGEVKLNRYDCVDLALGLECDDGHSLRLYKAMNEKMQRRLSDYASSHGRIIVSGAYVASDMKNANEQNFLARTLKVQAGGARRFNGDANVRGLGMTFSTWQELNEQHYAAQQQDILHPVGKAFCAMQYSDGTEAAIAYNGKDYKCFTMGFPFECVKSEEARGALMRGILNFVLTK